MKKPTPPSIRIARPEEDLAELTRLLAKANVERGVARAEAVLAQAERQRAEVRLDACLYALVVMHGQVAAFKGREIQESARKAMGGDTVSLAG